MPLYAQGIPEYNRPIGHNVNIFWVVITHGIGSVPGLAQPGYTSRETHYSITFSEFDFEGPYVILGPLLEPVSLDPKVCRIHKLKWPVIWTAIGR